MSRLLFLLPIASVVGGCRYQHETNARLFHDLKTLAAATKLFYFDNNRWPNELAELIEPSVQNKTLLDAIPVDLWGRPYEYSRTRPSICDQDQAFYVWTYGSDGKPGGTDDAADIGNWMIRD